jgi:acetylornithine deacetylase/succinyl-diaminopimelate desuccinylase-like protein
MTSHASDSTLAQHRITRLATLLTTHRAFHWLHLHQPQLRLWQLEMLAIPAPTFHEASRAAWFLERFRALGLLNVHLDEAGNALAELPAAPLSFPGAAEEPALVAEPAHPCILLSAHLDTVFPPGTPTTPTEDGPRILGPGSCDNAAGLTALLALAAALRFANIVPQIPILFAANVCEEGEGDLRGMRHLLEQGPYRGRIAAALALEGSGTASAVDRALGSRRFRVTISGPGGHSWTDAAAPNPITLLARGLAALAPLHLRPSPNSPARSTLSPGQIAGGTSINSIPESAHVLLDLRSEDPSELDRLELEIHRTFEQLIAETLITKASNTHGQPTLKIERIGNRPAATLPPGSPILQSLRAVDRHLSLRTELRLGSTDANIPISLGIPALAIASGGTGGGIHTLAEWYDPTGREIALRRILLLLLDLASTN